MDDNGTPGTGWDEEWEIFDLDEPAQRVSFVEGFERLTRAFFTGMAALSLAGLFVMLGLGKLSGGEFTTCFIGLCLVSGGTAVLIERPEYLKRLTGFARNAGRAMRTIEALSGSESGSKSSKGGHDFLAHDEDPMDGNDRPEGRGPGR
ncbi:hypothetical protein [Terrabacter sp. RAF57]|uniref:hypothetical protein n=1 Tax=Terrabacter sp. RAF57 TaxID=3233063 RepID=UPI003F998125